MRSQLLSFSCAFVGVTLLWRVDASCYYPDGSFPTDYVYSPCSDGTNSTCCISSEGDQCLSNGLCYSPSSNYLFRGACTDKSWNSPNCFQHCKTGDFTASSYDSLVSCGGNKYCCNSDGDTCCNDDAKVFTVDVGTVIKNLASSTSYTLPIATATGGNTGSFPTSASNAKTTGAKVSSSLHTNTAAAATSTSTSDTQDTNTPSTGVSKVALIAGAIGGVIVLLAVIAIVWFLVRRRYRKKLATGSEAFPMSDNGFQKLPDKSPRPVEVPAPLHPPPPQYQPPAYQSPPPHHGAVEIDSSYLPPAHNQYGQPVYEAPAQPYRHI